MPDSAIYPPIIVFNEFRGAVSANYLLKNKDKIDFSVGDHNEGGAFVNGLFDPKNRSEYAKECQDALRMVDFDVSGDKDLKQLLNAPHWTREQRVEWEKHLTDIVTNWVHYQPLFKEYRTGAKAPLERDFNKLQKQNEFDCDKMADTKALLMQVMENKYLGNSKDPNKSPTDYYIFSNYEASFWNAKAVHGFEGKNGIGEPPVLKGHAAIISSKTANVIEATEDSDMYDYKQNIVLGYNFTSFIAGEPLLVDSGYKYEKDILKLYATSQGYDPEIAKKRREELALHPTQSPHSYQPVFDLNSADEDLLNKSDYYIIDQQEANRKLWLTQRDTTPVNYLAYPPLQKVVSKQYDFEVKDWDKLIEKAHGKGVDAEEVTTALESANVRRSVLMKQRVMHALAQNPDYRMTAKELDAYIVDRNNGNLFNWSDGIIDIDELGKIVAAGKLLGKHVTVIKSEDYNGQDQIKLEDNKYIVTYKVTLARGIRSQSF